MRKLLLLSLVFVGCKSFDVYHRVTYPTAKSDKIAQAISQACANQGLVVQYSNQTLINTEWKQYVGFLLGERVRYNITFTDKEIQIRQLYSYQDSQTGAWTDNTSEPMHGARGTREKLANEIQSLLGPSAEVAYMKVEQKQ